MKTISDPDQPNRRVWRTVALATLALLMLGAGALWWRPDGAPAQPPQSPVAAMAVPTDSDSDFAAAPAGPIRSTAPVPRNPRAALLQLGEHAQTVVPNFQGEYPRVAAKRGGVITALVPFPAARPGESIRVQAEDGGALLDGAAGGAVGVDPEHQARVTFRVADGDGLQRVTLRHGSDTRVLEFWVGPEAPVLVRN